MENNTSPIQVFYSYAHEDEILRDKLEKHLKLLEREKSIKSWHDRRITAGSEWKGQIDENLENADIILLLVSADFMASDYCYDIEMTRAMEKHELKEACVIPIILREVDWTNAPFSKLQALPTDARPVTSRFWHDEDEAFKDITIGIRNSVQYWQQKKTMKTP